MFKLDPINQKRLRKFKALKRGYYSFWILAVTYLLSLGTELFIGNRPLFVAHEGEWYFPVLTSRYYPQTLFGGRLDIETDFRELKADPGFEGMILMPPHPYSPLESVRVTGDPPPAHPSLAHPFGTDDRGRDVLSRLAYGFRISISFALILSIVSYIVGVLVGALQGYWGGWIDLFFQRVVEVWTAMPFLYVVLLVSSIITPTFSILIGVLLLFRWIGISRYARAEVLRERNRDYAVAARALGASPLRTLITHVIPNSLTPVITLFPFALVNSIFALTALDYLGFGLPAPTPSWGELFKQGQSNLSSWWLTLFPFGALFLTLLLATFVGEALRDAWDPKQFHRRED